MDRYAARLDKYERFLRECLVRAKPDIIIWGPGRSDAQRYEKRKCVRNAIQRVVPNGDVVFPEDRKVIRATKKALGSGKVDDMERVQALTADIVIALDISAAVGEEVARYSAHPKIASKLFVVTTDAGKSGYQKAIRNQGFVHVLKADDVSSCDKPTELCINHVRSWCVQKCLRE